MIARPAKVLYLKDIFIPALCILFISALILHSEISIAAALKGIDLWLNIVLPSLFPFFVASELLNCTGFIRSTGRLLEPLMRPLFNVPGCGSFALLIGIISGYPVGARITCNLYENRDISKKEAERLLAFTNNSGPLFIVGAVATGMYGIPALGYLLLACNIAACLTVAFLLRFHGKNDSYKLSTSKSIKAVVKEKTISANRSANPINLGIIFGDSIKSSILLVINVGAFIIFFSVVVNLLLKTGIIGFFSESLALFLSPLGINSEMLSALSSGFFEITTGSNMTSKINNISINSQMIITSFIIGWAGLSVHSQVFGIVGGTGISLKLYFIGKSLQGIIAAFYTFLCLQLNYIKTLISQPVLSSGYPFSDIHWQSALVTSGRYLLFVLLVYILFCSVAFISKRFKKS